MDKPRSLQMVKKSLFYLFILLFRGPEKKCGKAISKIKIFIIGCYNTCITLIPFGILHYELDSGGGGGGSPPRPSSFCFLFYFILKITSLNLKKYYAFNL
jgi:hypothetical protein